MDLQKESCLWPMMLLGLGFGLFVFWPMLRKKSANNPEQQATPDDPKAEPKSQANISEILTTPPVRVIVDSLPPPVSPSAEEKTEKYKKKARDTVKYRAELVVGFFVVLYTIVTVCIWRSQVVATEQMGKQSELLTKQLEGTQAALVNAFQPTREDARPNNTYHISVRLENRGHAIAHGVNGRLAISYKSLPDWHMTSTTPWIFDEGDLPPTLDNPNKILKTQVVNIPTSTIERIDAQQETIVLEGFIDFNNGFEMVSEPVCYAWQSIPPNTGRNASFQPCGDVKLAIADWFGWQKQEFEKSPK